VAADPQARTRFARAAVLDTAKSLFLERGYAATTFEAISASSGVPSATVYRLFSSKLRLLQALFSAALPEGVVGADGEPASVPDHPQLSALLAEPDPRVQVATFAGIAREILSRVSQVYPILLTAAGSDRQAAELLAAYTRTRQQGQGHISRCLAGSRSLRPGLSERDAADIVYALASPEVYRLLVTDRGWSPLEYEQWLAAALTGQLLPTPREEEEKEKEARNA
jgi:AcrR family transcriptional regulator